MKQVNRNDGWIGALFSLVAAVMALGLGCGARGTADAGSPYLFINEVVPSNHHSCTDETGSSPDWVELYNASEADLDLLDYSMKDDTDPLTDLDRIASSVIVPAGGVKILWLDHRPDLGPTHLPFKLKSAAEKLLLYGPDNGLLDRVDWSLADTDVSYARFPDGSGTFVMCAAPTCNALNGSACAQ